MKYTSIVLNATYAFMLIFFLLDISGLLEIKGDFPKTTVYFGLPLLSLFLVAWNFFVSKKLLNKISGTLIPLGIFIVLISEITFFHLMLASSSWETETILYEKGAFQKIEAQVQNMGALGYNHRTVKVFYITPFLMIVNEVPAHIEKDQAWRKVDIELNPNELKH